MNHPRKVTDFIALDVAKKVVVTGTLLAGTVLGTMLMAETGVTTTDPLRGEHGDHKDHDNESSHNDWEHAEHENDGGSHSHHTNRPHKNDWSHEDHEDRALAA